MSTDIEDYRILKPSWPRAIWCFNSKMSQVAYITDSSELIQNRDSVGQKWLAAYFLLTSTFFSLLSTEGYFFTLYTIVVQSQKHRICKTLHEKVQTLLHVSEDQIGCVVITHIEHKNNAPFLHVLVVFCE